MRAVVFERYGPPENLSLREVEKPHPRNDEILIKVRAAAVNPLDWHGLRGRPLLARLLVGGFLKPGHQILGSDVAGTVESVGADVTRFAQGDDIFGMTSKHGAFAEYVVFSESSVIATKPSSLNFDEASAVPTAAMMALMGLRDQAKIKAGDKVLINGASGGIGTFAVQIAKAMGAEVTGVCSTRNLELVRSLGADRVIDYMQADFTQENVRYDVVFDVVAKRTFAECQRALAPTGAYVTTRFSFRLVFHSLWVRMTSGRRLKPMLQPPRCQDLVFLRDSIESRGVRPVIDKRFPLAEVPDAIACVGRGHARGKVVIEIAP